MDFDATHVTKAGTACQVVDHNEAEQKAKYRSLTFAARCLHTTVHRYVENKCRVMSITSRIGYRSPCGKDIFGKAMDCPSWESIPCST